MLSSSHQKSVLVWTNELQEKFLEALSALGEIGEKATASQILKRMEENGVIGLTRRQVASHLQKLQLKENKKAAVKRSAASSFESKPAQEDCPPTNNGQKRQMITQSDQFNTPNFGDGLYDAGFGSGIGAVGDSTFAGFNHGNYQFPPSFSGVNEQGSTLTLPAMAQRQFSLGNDEQNDNNNVDYVFDNIAGQQQFGQSVDMLYNKPTDYRQFQYHQQQGGEGAPNPSCHAAMNPPISTNTNPLNQPNFTNFGLGSTDKVVLSNPNYDNINNYAGNQQQSGEGVLTPNFPSNPSNKTSVEANPPTSQLDDELFPEGGFAEIMDLSLDEILAILDENTANSSNDEPNQLQAGEAEGILQINQPLNDHHDFPSSPFNQRITEEVEKLMKDDSANPSNDCHPILNRTPNQGWDDDDMDSFFEDLPF